MIRTESVDVTLTKTGNNVYDVMTSYGWDQYLPVGSDEYYLEFSFVTAGQSLRDTPFTVNCTMTLANYSDYYQYEYDNNNRMIGVSQFAPANDDSRGIFPGKFIATLFYRYDSDGNRIRTLAYEETYDRVAEDRSFVYENGKVLFEYLAQDRLERERFYA
ncbi:MAG: hypothetical protein ACK53L_26540, partial [Pirellulaceae bacterium]